MAIYRKLAAENPGHAGYVRMLAVADNGLGLLLAESGPSSEAEAPLAEATELLDTLVTKAPADVPI